MDHEAEAAGGCQACMGRMHGKVHVHFLPRTAQLCHTRHHTPQHKQIFPSAKSLSPTGPRRASLSSGHLLPTTLSCLVPTPGMSAFWHVSLCTYRQLSNKPLWTNRYIITYTSTHPFQKRKLPAPSHMTNKW